MVSRFCRDTHGFQFTGLPDGSAQLKTRSAAWNRAGWELNTLEG